MTNRDDREDLNCLVPRSDNRGNSRSWSGHGIEPCVALYGATGGYTVLANYMAADSYRLVADGISSV